MMVCPSLCSYVGRYAADSKSCIYIRTSHVCATAMRNVWPARGINLCLYMASCLTYVACVSFRENCYICPPRETTRGRTVSLAMSKGGYSRRKNSSSVEAQSMEWSEVGSVFGFSRVLIVLLALLHKFLLHQIWEVTLVVPSISFDNKFIVSFSFPDHSLKLLLSFFDHISLSSFFDISKILILLSLHLSPILNHLLYFLTCLASVIMTTSLARIMTREPYANPTNTTIPPSPSPLRL